MLKNENDDDVKMFRKQLPWKTGHTTYIPIGDEPTASIDVSWTGLTGEGLAGAYGKPE